MVKEPDRLVEAIPDSTEHREGIPLTAVAVLTGGLPTGPSLVLCDLIEI